MIKKKLLTIIFLFLLVIPLLRAEPKFKRFGLEEGLSNLTAECFCQDYMGYMWIGTSHGLNRFDGYSFTKYFNLKTDSTSLVDNQVLTLYEDRLHNLWVGTYGGLQLYDRNSNSFITYRFPDGYFSVKSLLQDSKGNLWIGTYGGSLYMFSYKEKKVVLAPYPQLKGYSIVCIYEDRNGNIWMGTEGTGVVFINHATQGLHWFKDAIPGLGQGMDFSDTKIRSITEDIKGNIWFGSYGKGVFIFDIQRHSMLPFASVGFPQHPELVMKIVRDSYNKLWVGIDGKGLIKYDPQTQMYEWIYANDNNKFSLASNATRCVYEDNQQNLWIGSYYGGISVCKLSTGKPFTILKKAANDRGSLPHSNITAIATDNKGTLWIGTDGGGLCTYVQGEKIFRKVTPKDIQGLDYSSVLSMYKDKNGKIWAGYYRGGLVSIDPEKMLIKQYFDEVNKQYLTDSKNDIRDIKQDNQGNLLIGTNGDGVIFFSEENGKIKHLKQSNVSTSLVNNYVRSLFIDSKGYIWIGTIEGLSRYNPKTEKCVNYFKNKNNYNSLLSNNVLYITEISNGTMCFGTSEGLCLLRIPVWSDKYDDPKLRQASLVFDNFTVINGLPDNAVTSITADNNHNLWLGTERGLAMFDIKRQIFRHYSTEEFAEDVFNRGACFKATDGKLCFGSVNGLVSFYPDSITGPTYTSNVSITDIKINYESVLNADSKHRISILSGQIELAPKEKALSFDFSALEMFFPNEIKYRYKLEGFDDSWNLADISHRTATYTNLNAGTYTFLVQCTNYQGEWNEKITEMKVKVQPSIWKTTWFKIVLVTLFALLLYVIYMLRISSIKRANKKLELLVNIKTKELTEEQEKQKLQELEKKEMILKQKELEAENLKSEKELIELKNVKLQYEIEKHKSEVEKKNSELTSLAAQMAQKIEFITKLKNNLSDIREKSNNEGQVMLTAIIKQIEKDNDIRKEWEQFEQHFNQTNNNFFIVLKEKYPGLTPHDIRMCGYLRMNLSNKEIAALQNISLRGVEKSRFRLRKKMQLENDKNIISFLMDLHS